MDSHQEKLQEQTYEELNSIQFEPCDDLPTIFSGEYQKEIRKENSAEVQALTSTESVEANIPTTEANDESQMAKEHSEVEARTSLQENCGRESENLEEATEEVGNAKLDGVYVNDFKDDIYDQLQDLTTDWKFCDYGISDAYFDEHGMPMEVHILTINEANDGEGQDMKEHSKDVGTALQGRCEQEFVTLDGAAKRVEEDDFSDNIYDQLEDLNMSRKSNYGTSDAYFDEYDLSINVPIYYDVHDLV